MWGFAGIFQELSVRASEPATPKMEAPCAAIKREPSELFPFRLQSYARWPTGFRACHMPLPTWQPGPAVLGAERDAGSDGSTHFRFRSAGGTVGCWVRGARWILTFAPASCTWWTSGREAPPTPNFLLGAAEGCGFGEGETVNPLGRLAGTG